MGKLTLFALVLVLVASAASAGVIVSEDWETGTDGWANYGTVDPHPALSTVQKVSGDYSLKTEGTATNYTNALQMTLAAETAKNWEATWNVFDTGSSREFVTLYSYSGFSVGSGTLQQVVSFGTYHSLAGGTTLYNFRVAVGSVNWALGSVTRTDNVWHAMKVEQIDNGNGTATINFYCDGAPAGTAQTTSVFGVTAIRVGSGVGNAGNGAYFDDVVLKTVPEPSSMLAMGTGLIGLIGLVRRRRS